jgi:hypothetical protein
MKIFPTVRRENYEELLDRLEMEIEQNQILMENRWDLH